MSNQISDKALIRNVTYGENFRAYDCRIIDTTIGKNCSIADMCTLRECTVGDYIELQRGVDLVRADIGSCTIIEKYSVVHDATVGKFCEISWGVSIGGDNHNYKLPSIHHFYWSEQFGFGADTNGGGKRFAEKIIRESCEIGNDVWIGTGVIVNRNVKVGNGAILASGCVVTKDVPPYAIVGGVPAKVIKMRFPQAFIDRLERIQWHQWPREILQKYKDLFATELCEETLSKLERIKEEEVTNEK